MSEVQFDVVIVGGRVAGSHLAARLGQAGLRVLLLERGALPSLPAVSSPIIYAPVMAMLDEIGAQEAAYARNTPRIHAVHNYIPHYIGALPIPESAGRDYGYAIDRARFDHALWQTAMQYETVSGRQNFSVTDLLWDGDQVIGVRGREKGGDLEDITARLVIGADGRFGIVARKTQAEMIDIDDDYPTSIYYAYWRNVRHVEAAPSAATYGGHEAGYAYLTMDSADDQTVIAIEGRADALQPEAGQVDDFYMELLQRFPALWERLADAERVTTVRGMQHVRNCYRVPGGAGWALVGDAYHQKDPLDGQGIYNAVITGKALAQAIRKWQRGQMTWDEALAHYDEIARIKTYPMYKALQGRIRTSFYAEPGNASLPEWAQQTLTRWLLQDEEFSGLMGQMLTRDMPPDMVTLMTPPTMIGAMARGLRRDVEREIKARVPFLRG